MLTVIAFIFVLTVVVCAHEIGHLLAAKASGIGVKQFGLGMGPTILSFTYHETKYSLHLFPIGGFVLLSGLDEEKGAPEPDPTRNYHNKSAASRFLAIFMGPMSNILLAWLIFVLSFSLIGVPAKITNFVGQVMPGSEADRVGLMVGDQIIALDGQPVAPDTMSQAIDKIHQSGGRTLLLKVLRQGQPLEFQVVPLYDEQRQMALIGFSPKLTNERLGPLRAIYYGCQQTLVITLTTLAGLKMLVLGKIGLGGLAGPLGIAQLTGQAAQQGLQHLLNFTAFLSINLAIVNLLPFPALDGGRLVLIILEVIARKPVLSKKNEEILNIVGFALLMALVLLLTYQDIMRLVLRKGFTP